MARSAAEAFALEFGLALPDGTPDEAVTVRDVREVVCGEEGDLCEVWVDGVGPERGFALGFAKAARFPDGSYVWWVGRQWGFTDTQGVDAYHGYGCYGAHH